jgi:DNA repair ATPase RecN
MIPRRWRSVAAAVCVVAAVATAASQTPPADADRVACEQLGNLSQVKAAVQQTLSQSKTAEATIVALAERMAGELNGCRAAPDGPSCKPDRRSQITAAVQKLTAQAEELQTARQAIEQRLKEIDEQRQALLTRLTSKDSCPHAQ